MVSIISIMSTTLLLKSCCPLCFDTHHDHWTCTGLARTLHAIYIRTYTPAKIYIQSYKYGYGEYLFIHPYICGTQILRRMYTYTVLADPKHVQAGVWGDWSRCRNWGWLWRPQLWSQQQQSWWVDAAFMHCNEYDYISKRGGAWQFESNRCCDDYLLQQRWLSVTMNPSDDYLLQ
jgi:hypothetical protein